MEDPPSHGNLGWADMSRSDYTVLQRKYHRNVAQTQQITEVNGEWGTGEWLERLNRGWVLKEE